MVVWWYSANEALFCKVLDALCNCAKVGMSRTSCCRVCGGVCSWFIGAQSLSTEEKRYLMHSCNASLYGTLRGSRSRSSRDAAGIK